MNLTETVKDVLDLRQSAEGHRSKTENILGIGRMYLESFAGAALAGYANGRSPVAGGDHAELFGAPVDLGGFVAANLAIVLGVTGEHMRDAANFGAGFMNVYIARMATKMGNEHRIEKLTGGSTSKQIGSGGFMGGAPIGRVTQVGAYSMHG
jgi:hypothetical protein